MVLNGAIKSRSIEIEQQNQSEIIRNHSYYVIKLLFNCVVLFRRN